MEPKNVNWTALEIHYNILICKELRGELTEEDRAYLNDMAGKRGQSVRDYLWNMLDMAKSALKKTDCEAGCDKDPKADTSPKEPVGQESISVEPVGQDTSQVLSDPSESEKETWRDDEKSTIQPIIEYLGFSQHCKSQYAEQDDCAVKKVNNQGNSAVYNLVHRAMSGKLTIGEINKFETVAGGDGQQLSPDERQAYEEYAENRGQTLQECLQLLSEINCFVRVTGQPEFDPDEKHAGMIDHYGRIPLFLPEVFANKDVMRTSEGRIVLAGIISLQTDEMKAQTKGRGKWPRETAVSVAKVWIKKYASILRNGEDVYADDRAIIWSTVSSALKRAHEEASGLLKHELCASYVEKAQVDAICGWLRATKEWFPPQLPWDAPKNVHEGLELLLDRFGLSGRPPAAVPAEISATAPNPPVPLTGNEEQGCAPVSPEQPASQKTPDAVGKLVILEWHKCLKYDGELFTIHGDERWNDIRTLMEAKGEFVKLEKGFPQRFAKNDAQRFKKLATEPEGPGRNGTGRYRIKP
jgi:hypothetical protein